MNFQSPYQRSKITNQIIGEQLTNSFECIKIPIELLNGKTEIGIIPSRIEKQYGTNISFLPFEKVAKKIYTKPALWKLTVDDVLLIIFSIINVAVLCGIGYYHRSNLTEEDKQSTRNTIKILKVVLSVVVAVYAFYQFVVAWRGVEYELTNRYLKSGVLILTMITILGITYMEKKKDDSTEKGVSPTN